MVTIFTSLSNKSYLKFEIARERFTASNPHQLLVLMVLLTIILGFLLLMVLRNQIKPIKTLASVAEAFGKGQSVSYKPYHTVTCVFILYIVAFSRVVSLLSVLHGV